VTAVPEVTQPALRRVSWRIIGGLTCTAAALCLLGAALNSSAEPTHAVIWGSLALTAQAAGLLCLVNVATSEQPGLGLANWKLGPWTLVWYGVAFGFASVTWSQPQTGTAAEIIISSVLRALWLVAIGMTAWALGYLTGCGRVVQQCAARAVSALSHRFATEVRGPSAPWILYAIGLAARGVAAVTTGLVGYVGDPSLAVSTATGYGQIFNLLSLLCPLALCGAALQVYRERLPRARVTLAVLLAAEFAYGAAAGGKEDFVIAVLAVVIPISAARRRLPKLAVITGILIFLVVVIPFNQAYRSAARGSQHLSTSQTIHQAPDILRQTVTGRNMVTAIPGSVTYLMQRIREIDSPAIIMQRAGGQIPFSSPALLVEAPVVDIIPRAVWPSKPILATGYQFSQQYYDLPSTVYTSSAITPVGDLYRHGGWIPVIIGMAILGCVVRLLDGVLDVRTNPHAILLVLLLFPALVKGEDDWVTLLASIPGTVLLWLFAVAVLFRPLHLRRPV